MKSFYVVLAMCAILTACSRQLEINDIYGIYSATKPEFGTLAIHSNGHYTHVFTENGVKKENKADWRIDVKDGKTAITFSQFKWPTSFSSAQSAQGAFWIVVIENNWSRLQLDIDTDTAIYFSKQKH